MITTFGLTKEYRNVIAVNSLNLRVEKGEICGFIGPNGAGKTTTIQMLATLTKPTAGHAEIMGYNVLTQQNDVKRCIGYMPDFFGVYDDMKVWEYLDFFAGAYGVPRRRRKRVVGDVLELTDLGEKRDEFVETLSRGMKQRLCLAKTLVHDPAVLLLDEPASGLDPKARIELRELIRELQRMGKTILVSSHILTELSDFCTMVAIIDRGRLLICGRVDAILGQFQGGRRVEIKIGSSASHAREILEKVKQVHDVEIEDDGQTIVVVLDEAVEDTSTLLAFLVKQGVKVRSLREVKMNLEDAFLRITERDEEEIYDAIGDDEEEEPPADLP